MEFWSRISKMTTLNVCENTVGTDKSLLLVRTAFLKSDQMLHSVALRLVHSCEWTVSLKGLHSHPQSGF